MKKTWVSILWSVLCCMLVAGAAGAVLPSGNGQTTKAKSVSVVIASDQTVPVSGTITATVDTSALATSAKQDTGNTSVASIDGKFPASAAFGDNTANPTSTFVKTALMGYDGPSNNWDGIRVGIQTAGSPFGYIDVLPAATYNSSDPAATNGQAVNLQVSPKGHLKTVATNLFANQTSAATTTIKSGAGILHTVNVGTCVSGATLQFYDNTSASSPTIAKITCPASTAGMATFVFDLAFATGLTVVSSGATDVTESYQ